jgi:hypothetical protein
MIFYFASTFALALCALWIYLYYLKKGQFEDPEDVKYQLFREEEK